MPMKLGEHIILYLAFTDLEGLAGCTDHYCNKFYNVLLTHIKRLNEKTFIEKIKNYLCQKAYTPLRRITSTAILVILINLIL